MNTLLQRYKLPADKQVTYIFYFSEQGGDLFDQSQFVQEDNADGYGSNVFDKKGVGIEEVERNSSLIRQFRFQDLFVDTRADEDTDQHST